MVLNVWRYFRNKKRVGDTLLLVGWFVRTDHWTSQAQPRDLRASIASLASGQWTASWRPVAPRKQNSSSQEPGLGYRQKASDSSKLMQTYSGCSNELNGTPLFWHSPLSTRVWGGTRRTASLERCPANARMTVEARQKAGGKALESRSAVCVRSLRLG